MYLQTDLTKTLAHIPWFAGLSQKQLDNLANLARLHEIDAGEVLFNEGDRDNYMYVLLEGQVELEVEVPTRGQVHLYTADVLDIIGWSSVTPIVRQRTATARANQPSMLLGFNSKLLEQLCEEDTEIGFIIMRRVANVAANRLLTTRLCLYDMVANPAEQQAN